MTVALALFYLAGALTLGGALGVVMARNIDSLVKSLCRSN